MGAKLKIFCDAKVHCETCRSATIAGLAWRLQLLAHLDPKPEGSANWICPEGKPFDGTPPEEKDVPAELIYDPTPDNVARLALAGRAHWDKIHSLDHVPTPAEFAEWVETIPSYGCACRDKFKAYLAAHPFDFSSLETFRRSGVDAHNAVSLDIGKPSMEYSQVARARNWPTP